MVNRQRFLLDDLDSEGFPRQDSSPFAALNIGRIPEVHMAQALLADRKCLNCFAPAAARPSCKLCGGETHDWRGTPWCFTCGEQANPPGWQEVDGVKLPPITWADENPHTTPVEAKKAVAEHLLHGITKLSDSTAPDAYFGWKDDAPCPRLAQCQRGAECSCAAMGQ